MINLPGFQDFQILHMGRKHRVLRAIRQKDGATVAIKTPMAALPAARELAALTREHATLRRLAAAEVPHVPRPLDLLDTGRSLALVMSFIEAPSLAQTLRQHGPFLPAGQATGIFVGVAEILAHLHALGVIHRDVTPANILVPPDGAGVALVDFGSAVDMPLRCLGGLEGDRRHVRPETIEGAVPYMSPEQTGRINRPLDHRTDFYSLGVSLHESLVGSRPFQGRDIAAVIHAHIALAPPSARSVLPTVPHGLCDLILKCLAKDAADRHQTAAGLLADLRRCLQSLELTGDAPSFPLGEEDFSDRLLLPQRLVGRTQALAALHQIWDGVCHGERAMVLVHGESGVGKTSLVQELHRAVAAGHGYVTYGKFDQYHRATPCSAFVQAFSHLVRQLLAESDQRVEDWKERILAALGDNAQILCEVVPELVTLLGPRPPVPPLPPVEARERFGAVFGQFLEVFGDARHPLLLFLDDLQWVDAASLDLLERFALLDRGLAICCICAWRDNEVSASHPLAASLDRLRAAPESAGGDARGERLVDLPVERVEVGDLADFLAETLRRHRGEVLALAEAIHAKTGGNPLAFRTLVANLAETGALRWDQRTRRWIWDLPAVQAAPFSENMVEALRDRLGVLPPACGEVLAMGACLGSPFPLSLLAALAGLSQAETVRRLKPALALGVLAASPEDVELHAQDAAIPEEPLALRFTHDRIQQAAYALLDPARAPALHLAAARLLMQDEAAIEQLLFDLADHLEKAASLLETPAERRQAAALALRAGEKARAATAFADAARLFGFVRSLMPEDAPHRWPDLWLAASLGHVESLALCGRAEEAEALAAQVRLVLEAPGREADLLRLVNILAKQYHQQARHVEAIEMERAGLALLGIELPRDDAALLERFHAEKARVDAVLESLPSRHPRDLEALPDNHDPNHALALDILFDLFADGYLVGQGLLCATVSAVMARLCAEGGNAPQASVAYINYACTLCAMGLDYPGGHAMGSLAVRLAEKHAVPAFQNYAYHVFSLAVNHWHGSLKKSHDYWSQAARLALAAGSPYAGYVHLQLAHVLLAMGAPLAEVERQMERGRDFLERRGLGGIVMLLRLIVIQPLRHLQGLTASPATLDDESFQAAGVLEQFGQYPFFVGSLRYSQLRVACLAGEQPDPDELKTWMDVVEGTQQGQVMLADSRFFYTLLLLDQLAALCPEETRSRLIEEVEQGLERFRTWASLCPDNFGHKALLLRAEHLRATSRDYPVEAMDLYDQAIDAALASGFIQDAALAAQKACAFWLERGKPHFARGYLDQCLNFHGRWGATGMTTHLRRQHQALLGGKDARLAAREELPGLLETSTSNTAVTFSEGIDLASVIKATQAISRHMVMEDLGRELTAIAMENAGATRGVLVLKKRGQFVIANAAHASPAPEGNAMSTIVADPLPEDTLPERSGLVPMDVLQYVMRAGAPVFQGQPGAASRFAQCDYLRQRAPASYCCLPIAWKKEVRGLLYLENDTVPGVFQEDRIQTLGLLASQAAISMENARVYAEISEMNRNLEHLVRGRTLELHAKNEELHHKNEELHRLSTTDQLTGVANRRSIEDRLEQAIARRATQRQAVAVILMDVDRFKSVNDTYGHAIGDEVLVHMAGVMSSAMRGTDLFGRWGGEEFLVVVSDFITNAPAFAERLRAALEAAPHAVAGRITASMGLAVHRQGESASTLVSRADEALYRAKQNGRNRVELAD